MGLSDETLAAMRKGGVLQIAWLSEEAVRTSLAGAAQGVADLRTCGAQVSAQHRVRLAAQEEAPRPRRSGGPRQGRRRRAARRRQGPDRGRGG